MHSVKKCACATLRYRKVLQNNVFFHARKVFQEMMDNFAKYDIKMPQNIVFLKAICFANRKLNFSLLMLSNETL